MNRIFYTLLMALLAPLAVTSCKDYGDVSRTYSITVSPQLPEGVSVSDLTSAKVTAVNAYTGRGFVSEEIAPSYTFEVPGGIYAVTFAMRYNEGGIIRTYNGSMNVDAYQEKPVSVSLDEGISGGLIFKEVYYNMVKPNGKTPYMRDQFFEIYNNSDEMLYLDNCALAILDPGQGKIETPWKDENGEIMKEYAVSGYIPYFAGSGSDYPLQPGKSIVIASQALDHTAETRSMADLSKPGAMLSPVNLEKADYEVCLIDYKPTQAVDNPLVPNINVYLSGSGGNFFFLPYQGKNIILAKFPGNPMEYLKDEAHRKPKPGSSVATRFAMVPQEFVLDGINIVSHVVNDQRKCLRPEVDAGKVGMSAMYAGKSIRRKVESITADGRVVFKDTNNSTEDFLSDLTPTPGIIPDAVDE